jgi:hypothetical protein
MTVASEPLPLDLARYFDGVKKGAADERKRVLKILRDYDDDPYCNHPYDEPCCHAAVREIERAVKETE